MSEQPNEAPETENTGNEPQTHLETVLVAGQADPGMAGTVIGTFLREEVYFLSREEVGESTENVQPLLLQNSDGSPLIALFTHVDRIPATYIEEAPFAVRVVGAAVIDNLQGAGMVINPGHPIGFEIGPEGVESIRRDFRPDGTSTSQAPGDAAPTQAPE